MGISISIYHAIETGDVSAIPIRWINDTPIWLKCIELGVIYHAATRDYRYLALLPVVDFVPSFLYVGLIAATA